MATDYSTWAWKISRPFLPALKDGASWPSEGEGGFSPSFALREGNQVRELDDETRPYHMLVEEVYSRIPDVSKYGLPDYAHDELVKRWLEEDMGWGYIVDAHGNFATNILVDDTGDDTAPQYWAQVRVSPTLHAWLVEQSKEHNNGHWRAVRPDVPEQGPVDEIVRKTRAIFGEVFSDMAGSTAGEMLESLCGVALLELPPLGTRLCHPRLFCG